MALLLTYSRPAGVEIILLSISDMHWVGNGWSTGAPITLLVHICSCTQTTCNIHNESTKNRCHNLHIKFVNRRYDHKKEHTESLSVLLDRFHARFHVPHISQPLAQEIECMYSLHVHDTYQKCQVTMLNLDAYNFLTVVQICSYHSHEFSFTQWPC